MFCWKTSHTIRRHLNNIRTSSWQELETSAEYEYIKLERIGEGVLPAETAIGFCPAGTGILCTVPS